METITGIMVGIGLSAACGFRVFVPFLGLSFAAMNGYVTLAGGFEWLGTWPAFLALLIATGMEIAAYYIPAVDNLLDAVAAPLAVIAGVLATAAVLSDIPPFYKWSLAIIAGGGAAGVIQGGTTLARAAATTTLPGPANFLVASAELLGAIGTTAMAILIPVVTLTMVVIILLWLLMRRLRFRRANSNADMMTKKG